MNVVCFQMWSVMNVGCYERGLLWTGLLWTRLLWTWSVMKVVCYGRGCYERVCYERVCYEQVCYERGLFWVVCCDWSDVNGSVLKGNRCRTALWFWFRITPTRISYFPRGVIYPQFGNHCFIQRRVENARTVTLHENDFGLVESKAKIEFFEYYSKNAKQNSLYFKFRSVLIF